jgi:hypothetical protein
LIQELGESSRRIWALCERCGQFSGGDRVPQRSGGHEFRISGQLGKSLEVAVAGFRIAAAHDHGTMLLGLQCGE